MADAVDAVEELFGALVLLTFCEFADAVGAVEDVSGTVVLLASCGFVGAAVEADVVESAV